MKLGELVGKKLNLIRRSHGYTLEDVSARSHVYGTKWSAGTIASLEKGGSKADSIPNLIILVAALNDLAKEQDANEQPLTLADLIDTPGIYVEISPAMSVKASDVANALRGGQVNLDLVDTGEAVARDTSELLKDTTAKDIAAATSYTPAEERQAKRLNVSTMRLRAMCEQLYGHTIDDEIRKRAGEKATPQKRGRVVRNIIDELRGSMESEQRASNEHDRTLRDG